MSDRLTEIEERLKDGTAYRPAPHRPVVNTAGDRHGVVDSSGCVVDMGSPAAARFYAAAPTDMAALLGAIRAALAVHEPVDALMYGSKNAHKVQVCSGCGQDDGNWNRYPCPTVTAINAALEGK
jgi:hypothetical protein